MAVAGVGVKAGEGEFAFEVEFAGAEGAFVFLNGGVALADGGAFSFVDEGPELFEGVQVVGIAVAVVCESEVEGLLFEEFEGVFRETGIAGDGIFAEFGGGFFGIDKVIDLADELGAIAVANEGHVRDLLLKLGATEFDDLAVRDFFFQPGVDVFELTLGKIEQAREWATARWAGGTLI